MDPESSNVDSQESDALARSLRGPQERLDDLKRKAEEATANALSQSKAGKMEIGRLVSELDDVYIDFLGEVIATDEKLKRIDNRKEEGMGF